MTLPSQVEPPAPEIDLAFDPDLSFHPAAWAWTSATADLLKQSIKIKKGRDDEIGIVTPSGTAFQLDNRAGIWTPADARSPHWPHMEPNTPARISLPGGVSRVALDGKAGTDVSTPDAAATSITGDIDVRAEAEITWYNNPLAWGVQELARKWETTSNQRSYRLLQLSRQVSFQWSPDGTAAAALSFSAVSPPIGRGAIRATLDVNNGAGGWTGRFYWAPTLDGPWTLFHEETGVGTTSIFNSTAPLRVGPTTIGYGYRFEVYADTTGSDRRAAPDFTALPTGAAVFVDAEGLTWTFNGTAAVTDLDVRCFGQIGEISPTWPYGDISGPNTTTQPGEARVDITIAGILRRLSQGQKALRSTLYRLITSPSNTSAVAAYWPLEEGRDATQASSPIPGVLPGLMAMPFAADDTLASSAPLPSQTGGQPFGWDLSVPSTASSTDWEVTWFVRVPTAAVAPAFTDLMRADTLGGTISQWVVRLDDTDLHLFAKDLDGVNILSTTIPTDPLMLQTWDVAELSVTQNGANVDYAIRLTPEVDGSGVFVISGTLAGRTCGRLARLRTLVPAAPADGISMGHVIVTSGKVNGWLAGADTAWVNETASHRVFRLCDEENIPVEIIGDELVSQSFRGDPTKSTRMGPQGQRTLVDLLSECADVDMGILSEQDGRPGVTYRTRQSLYNQPVALDLDAAFGNVGDITHPFEPTRDDQALRNDVTVKRESGSEHRETTDPPPQPGDVYEETVTVNVAGDDQLVDQAGWRLHLGTWPGMRYRSVTTELTAAAHQMDPWRAVRLGDRLAVSNLPPQHPAPDVVLLVQGWTETLSVSRWTAEANCTPAGPWDVGVTDDDTPTTSLARLPSTGSGSGTTLAGALTSTQTGVRTVNVTGPLWTTAAAYFPMDIEVDGEVMTLSGISGASSPQTFTISARAVNGVSKAHPSGAAVDVANPFRAAM